MGRTQGAHGRIHQIHIIFLGARVHSAQKSDRDMANHFITQKGDLQTSRGCFETGNFLAVLISFCLHGGFSLTGCTDHAVTVAIDIPGGFVKGIRNLLRNNKLVGENYLGAE